MSIENTYFKNALCLLVRKYELLPDILVQVVEEAIDEAINFTFADGNINRMCDSEEFKRKFLNQLIEKLQCKVQDNA
jgi:hypothetical protein